MYSHVCAVPWRKEVEVRSFGAEVTGGCKSSKMDSGIESSPLEQQQVLLTSEASLYVV